MTVLDHLRNIEEEYKIKILLAVEAGSRAWGFESRNSDWDVRFIYVHKPEWYFKINKQRDVIEHIYGDIDLVGWELKKTLSLLKASNTTLFEWINSPIVYLADEDFVSRIREVEQDFFKPLAAMYHYIHIYKNHDERYLQRDNCSMKQFLYYFRGVLACKWIEQRNTLPPVPFIKLVELTIGNKDLRVKIEELIRLKKSGEEQDMRVVDSTLMRYARQIGDYYCESISSYKPKSDVGSTQKLDAILYDMVNSWYLYRKEK